MGLALSVLVFSIGVLEALSCMEHVRQSYLPLEFGRKRRRLVLDVGSGTIRHRETRRSSEFQRDPVSLLRRLSRQFAPDEDETLVCEELAAIWDRVESGRVHSTEILQQDPNLLVVRDGGEESETASRSSTPATVILNLDTDVDNIANETDIPFEESFCPKCVDEKFDLLASSTDNGHDVILGIQGACFHHDVFQQNNSEILSYMDESLEERDSAVLHKKESKARTEPNTEFTRQALILNETSDFTKDSKHAKEISTLCYSQPADYATHSSINDNSELITRSNEEVVKLENAVLATNQTDQTIIEKKDEKIKKEASRSETLITSDLDDCLEFKTQISSSEDNSCEISLLTKDDTPKRESLPDYVSDKTENYSIRSLKDPSTKSEFLNEGVSESSNTLPKSLIQEVSEIVSEWLGLSGQKETAPKTIEDKQNVYKQKNVVSKHEDDAVKHRPEEYKDKYKSLGQTSLIQSKDGLDNPQNETEQTTMIYVESSLNTVQTEGNTSFEALQNNKANENLHKADECEKKVEQGTSVEQDVSKRRLQKQNNIDIGRVNTTKELLRTGTIIETKLNESHIMTEILNPEDMSNNKKEEECGTRIQMTPFEKRVQDNELFQFLVEKTKDELPTEIVFGDINTDLSTELSKEKQCTTPSEVASHEIDPLVNNNEQVTTTKSVEITSCNIENVPPNETGSKDVRKNNGKYVLQDITSEIQNSDIEATQINLKTISNNDDNQMIAAEVLDVIKIHEEETKEHPSERITQENKGKDDTCQQKSLINDNDHFPKTDGAEERLHEEGVIHGIEVTKEVTEKSNNEIRNLLTEDHNRQEKIIKDGHIGSKEELEISVILEQDDNVILVDQESFKQEVKQIKDEIIKEIPIVQTSECQQEFQVYSEEQKNIKHAVNDKQNILPLDNNSNEDNIKEISLAHKEVRQVETGLQSTENVEMKANDNFSSHEDLIIKNVTDQSKGEDNETNENKTDLVHFTNGNKQEKSPNTNGVLLKPLELEHADRKALQDILEVKDSLKPVETDEASVPTCDKGRSVEEVVGGRYDRKAAAKQEVRQLTGLEGDVTVVEGAEPPDLPGFTSIEDISSPEKAFWLIFSGEYTKAMSKDWHSGHFCCWQCDESLTGQRYVLRDDHPYCIKCYEQVFANTCDECSKVIGIDSKDLSYKDKHWHEACFLCSKCRVSLVDKQFGSKADKIYCGNCYDAQFASRCDGCSQIFRAGTKKMEYKTRQWHEQCFCCCVCKTAIGTKSFIPREQEIYCAGCYEEKFATRCVKCNKIITSGGVTYKNEPWHRECFTCTNCSASLAGQRFTSRDEKPYCADCFGELFAKRCTACCKPITGIGGTRFISFEDRHWHNDCFICASCKSSLVGRGFITDAEDILCTECAKQKLM